MTSLYPTENELNKLLKKNEYFERMAKRMTRKELESTVVYLRIYFDRLELEKMDEIPKITIIDLVSSIGGTVGLFLGMSFMSFFEIFDLLSYLVGIF